MHGKIVIACREEACRNLLLRHLTEEGTSVFATCNEADLLLEILERDYDAIIYDLENSLLDGLKMVRILRMIRPKVSLFVLSPDPSKELGGRILQEGVIYYGVKPINPDTVKRAVSSVLAKRA